jgi:integrase
MTDPAFRRAWDSYLLHLSRAAGHPISIRPHDLRHTYCARFLRDAGVDMKQAMLWMGHADEKMILRIYDHVGEKRTRDSIDRVEKLLIGMQNGMQENKESP